MASRPTAISRRFLRTFRRSSRSRTASTTACHRLTVRAAAAVTGRGTRTGRRPTKRLILRRPGPHMRAVFFLLLTMCAAPLGAQEAPSLTVENPLAALKDELAGALTASGLPFTEEQERAIVLMMDERFRASETLFGDLMNFSGGPTSGQQADRLKSAIEWMRKEFATQIQQYLTEPQRGVWARLEASALAAAAVTAEQGGGAATSQTQYVRINNNAFTAEGFFFRSGGSGTEVIERGGVGAWHGNAEYLMKDEALNARNAFAGNKPPYQER